MTDLHRTLVVVEDSEHVRRALTRVLSSHGYDVRAFASAEAWLEAVCPADAAIVDVSLPRMSGFELCERLRCEGHALPTVFITADATGLAQPGRTILQKPFDPQDLLDLLERAFASSSGPLVSRDSA